MKPRDPSNNEVRLHSLPASGRLRLLKSRVPVECGGSTTGFASPADDYLERRLDLHEFYNVKANVCFLVEAKGQSMIDADIQENDLIVVDTSLEYREGDLVVCTLNDALKLKLIEQRDGGLYLVSRNPAFAPIPIDEFDDFRVFGVAKGLARNFR